MRRVLDWEPSFPPLPYEKGDTMDNDEFQDALNDLISEGRVTDHEIDEIAWVFITDDPDRRKQFLDLVHAQIMKPPYDIFKVHENDVAVNDRVLLNGKIGTVTEVIWWMDNSTEARVRLDDDHDNPRKVMLRAPHGDLS